MTAGPYSVARRVGDWVIVSGQLGMIDGVVIPGGFLAELDQALRNLAAALETVGASPADVVKTTVFLGDIDDWAALNEPYVKFFRDAGATDLPARTAFQAGKLPRGGSVEIEAWAYVGP